MILPPARVDAAPGEAWAPTNAYASGTLIGSGGMAFACVLPGTSDSNTVFSGADDVEDGTVTWRRVASFKRRQGFALTVTSVGDVYLNLGYGAAEGRGVKLPSASSPHQVGSALGGEAYQGPVYLYSTSAVVVTGTEW